MTQNEKDLLIKDLCTRLPYGIKVEYENEIFDVEHVCPMYEEVKLDIPETWTIDVSEVKPYLFPMSNMTEEQDKEYALLQTSPGKEGFLYVWNCATMMKWLIENRFDYNGLIPKGLANDATGKNIY